MVRRNANFEELERNYLFVEIANRRKAFHTAHPDVKLVSLGIGDTTHPFKEVTVEAFVDKAKKMGTKEGYEGYPDYNGSPVLRKAVVDRFYKACGITDDEVFISDGSKPDLARLQFLFPESTAIAVQDPVYPAYVDGSVISGKAGSYMKENKRYSNIQYMECTPENGFFPELSKLRKPDLIFFCSPNNPTGTCATRQQLTELVRYAKENKSIIIYDAAYSYFINDADHQKYPRTIYEIEGAKDVAFETNSFSKFLGFTGVRLGWTTCPKSLKFEDGTPVISDWARICGTLFNGPSVLSQAGAIESLTDSGFVEVMQIVHAYMRNAQLIKKTMESLGFECYGGEQCPYIWMRMPGKDSWDAFQEILEKAHVITTPGSGFGTKGSGFVRLSALCSMEDAEEATRRLLEKLR